MMYDPSTKLKTDKEFKRLILPMISTEYKQLETQIKQNGCKEPIIIWKGIIIDGYEKYEKISAANLYFNMVSKPVLYAGEDGTLVFALRNGGSRSVEIREWLRNESENVKIMIGGAPITDEYCKEIGADAYTSDAASAAEAAVALITNA